ncbi:MAG: VanZ family protein [Acidobacteria bacterium]|nr:VanZ family protein [Acidobacteriota bacterium]
MLNQLLGSFIFSTAVALPLWVAFRVRANVSGRKLNAGASLGRELLLTSFFLYLVFVAALTVVPIPMSRFRVPGSSEVNLVPILNSLKCLPPTLTARRNVFLYCLQNMAGNIFLFLPLGFFLPLVSDRFGTIKRVLLVALVLSSSIEVVQFLSRLIGTFRTVDVDDVILNTLGAGVGFLLFTLVKRKKKLTH